MANYIREQSKEIKEYAIWDIILLLNGKPILYNMKISYYILLDS